MELEASQTAVSLLTEHLQYTPLSLIDDIINSVNNFVYQGVGSLETGLLSTSPERLGFKAENEEQDRPKWVEAKQEIEEGLHKLETLLNSTVDKNFDKFEIYILRNILSIPADLVNWMQLRHYEDLPYPPLNDACTPESVKLLRCKLSASRSLGRLLAQEHARNEIMLQQLRGVCDGVTQPNSLSYLTSTTATENLTTSGKLQCQTTNTNFAMSQLPSLKVLIADLRPQLQRLRDTETGANSARNERRQERRDYIEQRTQAHLTRNGLLLLESGSGVVGGRNDLHELESLEKVAEMLHPT